MTWDEFDEYTWDEAGQYEWGTIDGYYGIESLRVANANSDVDAVYPRESPWNIYTIMDNPFLQIQSPADITTLMKPIYDEMQALGSCPATKVECIGNYLVESGDIITVQVGDKFIVMPIYARTLSWHGSITDEYEVTGTRNWETVTRANKAKIENQRLIKIYTEDEYYHIRSGIAIEPAGIEIDGSKYVDIKAGSELKVESGGNVNIKSGGSLNVASGGNIDIHASGTLELTGTSVSIKSNSTFDLDANNFKINSAGQYIKVPVDSNDAWIFDNHGLRLYNSVNQKNVIKFSGDFVGGTMAIPDAGFFAYIKDGDTTHGRVAITAIDRVLNNYNYIYFEHNNGMGYLNPGISLITQLGASDRKYIGAYINKLYSNSMIMQNSMFTFCNANEDGRCVFYSNESKSKFQIYHKETGFYVELTGTVVAPSSRAKKHNIHNLDDAGNVIDRLKPVSFAYNNDKSNKTHFGLIYEDTVGVLPEICEPGDERTDKAINYVELIPVLLKEIKSLRKRVKELEEVKA